MNVIFKRENKSYNSRNKHSLEQETRLEDNLIAVVRRCSVKKGVLKNFTKFTGKYMRQNLFFNKVAGLRPASLLKKRLWHRWWFPVNFVKFLETPFFYRTPLVAASEHSKI